MSTNAHLDRGRVRGCKQSSTLQAALGGNNPFVGEEWEVSPADIGKAAFKRLRDNLTQGGVVNALRDLPTAGLDSPATNHCLMA